MRVLTLFPAISLRALVLSALFCLPSIGKTQDGVPPLILDDTSVDAESWIEKVSDPSTPRINFTTRSSNEIFEHDTQVVAPLFSNGDGTAFLFTALSYNHRDNGNRQFSGGVFLRCEIPDLNGAVLGFSVHGDTTDTNSGNQIDQFGLGFDLFTKSGIDLHGNIYLAEEDRHLIGTIFRDPYAQGNSILQNEFGMFEQGLSGGDFRIAFPVPVLERVIPARAFVGGYSYDGAINADISGLMAGIDLFPFTGVALGAEYFGDDEFYGDNWVFKASMSVPIDSVFSARDWRNGLARTFSRTTNDRNSFEVRSNSAGPRRNWVMTETAINPTPIQIKTIRSNVIFVNNGGSAGNGIQAGSAGGSGTAENPTNTIQRGANFVESALGGSGTVYVQAGGAYNETIEVGARNVFNANAMNVSNIAFISSFKPIAACGGLVFGGETARPLVNGGFILQGDNGLSSAEISGFEIVGGNSVDGHGIFAEEVSTVIATSNTFRNVGSDGINVQNLSGSSATTIISDNQFIDSSRDAIEIDHFVEDGSESRILVSNNKAEDSSDGVEIEVDGFNAMSTIVVTGNEFLNSRDNGIDLRLGLDGGEGFVTVSGNTVRNTSGNEGIDIQLEAYDGSDISLTMDSNTVEDTTSADGAYVFFEAEADSEINGVISNNIFSRSRDDGLSVSDNSAADNSRIGLVITGNQFLNNGANGLYLETDWTDTTATVTIANNTARGSGDEGFNLEIDMGAQSTAIVNVDSNIIVDNGDDGAYVFFEIYEESSIVGNFRNNVFRNNAGAGLSVYDNSATDDSDVTLVITGNSFLSNDDQGLDFETDWADGGDYSVTISNNIASGNSDDGFRIAIDASDENSAIPLVMSGNQFLNNGGDSLNLNFDSDAGVIVSGTGNTSSGAGSGNALFDNGTIDATGSIEIDGNTINFPSPGNIAD